MDEKDAAQLALDRLADAPRPGEHWTHYKGGLYEVVAVSLAEDSLTPLVTYHSLLKGYFWTRTLDNWRETVNGQPRFVKTS